MSDKREQMSHVRRKIEDAIEAAEEDRRRKLLMHRLELARNGIAYYRSGRLADAARNYHAYLRILEETKNVGEGGLGPHCFNIKKEISELLLVSAVYWDLTKLYDRTRSKEKVREFQLCLEKYILFSKGLPYQGLCADNVRRYIEGNKPIHKQQFKNAYEVLRVTRCFVATELSTLLSPETLPLLQNFRDAVLKKNYLGRIFIVYYYKYGPKIAYVMRLSPNFIRKGVARLLDQIASLIGP